MAQEHFSEAGSGFTCRNHDLEEMELLRTTDPEGWERALEARSVLDQRTAAFDADGLRGGETTYVIPVVFHIIHDNGPENISSNLPRWAQQWGIRFEYIQPGKPQQNAYVERFNRTVRYEWLSQYHWSDLEEVQMHATQWMWKYNHDRPNMALGGITPKQRLAMVA
jgi:transposase InsO family protein